ncbi:hypothetical protein H2198_005820 [Neophaeococcomyces mojaviensis]|uniref:Uncharacterized protein n=1 Tax=Neophaeococcomyces mojaviensis TaxID=3383035 RepID=A0ACC3A4P7_9EURO|nr:hypothetical protein H2198_005820 [Knufia sp. JES_112]
MAVRKSSSKATTASTPRRSTRRNVKSEDVDSKPIKQEETSPEKPKANTSAKRTSSGAADTTPQKAKRVKVEKTGDGDETAESTTGSPNSPELDSELSEVPSSPEASDEEYEVKEEGSKKRKAPSTRRTPRKSSKAEPKSNSSTTPKKDATVKAADLQAKKLKSYAQFAKKSPFSDFIHPTPEEARLAHRILASIHGERIRPDTVVARNDQAGCGDSPSVLDALVRTILSQNTSDKNSTRAKLSMDKVYGGSDHWEEILNGGQAKLQEAIKSGGLSVVKSKVIISILEQVKEKYGKFSLDHLFDKSDEEAMTELISFQGVGPKTASCVLLFCLKRESFAVDTHVYRIAGLLGWRPKNATRDETHAHLEVRIPDEDKYGLHILMVGHGKKCEECKAGGRVLGKCELRKAFRKGKLEGEAGEEVKEEEEEVVKNEGEGNELKDPKQEDVESGQEDYLHGMQWGKSQKKEQKQVKSKAKSKK